ncbi:MAG TPA: CinA family protein, partial [Rhizomicrobium sp.]
MFPPALLSEAKALLSLAREKNIHIATAESCTGGLIAGLLTEIPGSSDVVDRGFVTYSNEAKEEMLGVPANILDTHGAVSAPVARAMAEGALK